MPDPTAEMVEMAEGIAQHVADRVHEQVVGPLRDENLELRERLEGLMKATYVLLRSTVGQSPKPAGHFDAWAQANEADVWFEAHPLPTKGQ